MYESYAVQENTVMKGVDPTYTDFSGEIIYDAVF